MKYLATFARALALVLGFVAINASWKHVLAWKTLDDSYKAYYGLILFFGIVLLGEAVFALRQRRYSGLHLMAITGTALTLAGVQFIGLATKSILCTTPT